MADQNKFLSQLISIRSLSERSFLIPTYQRPYVWGVEQIEKLLSDAQEAFLKDPGTPYFIGTVLTEKRAQTYELIDGQQRFTTLWMVAAVFHGMDIQSDIRAFLKLGKALRIDFEIRKEVRDYFELLAEFPVEAAIKYSSADLKSRPYLEHITAGLSTIRSRIEELQGIGLNLPAFGNFLLDQLIMVENIAPDQVDLNKLFATINSSGIQLEQSDILKSKLLSKLSQKVLYSKIWEACENMGDYFERNVRKIFIHSNWAGIHKSQFATFDPQRFLLSSEDDIQQTVEKTTISAIFYGQYTVEISVASAEEKQHTLGFCRSVISFSQLLIHTYRIHLFRQNRRDFAPVFHPSKLIEIFEALCAAPQEEIKQFFALLWEIRFILDKYVIKWTADLDTKDEYLELSRVSKNEKNSFTRNIMDKSAQQMLQSVLYFTGDYLRQYWLTPLLHHLAKLPQDRTGPSSFEVLTILEKIDNQISLTNLTGKEVSFLLLSSLDGELKFDSSYLKRPMGTGFYRYWFQKTEYVLWKVFKDRNDERFKKFRISSKNSIEHAFPQRPEDRLPMDKQYLDSFGNLVLLSVRQNSEYGRKQVNVKRAEFEGKRQFDSLKSYEIFASYPAGEQWNEQRIIDHRDKMIALLDLHYLGDQHPMHAEIAVLEAIEDDEFENR
ncbi:DUF262 domain-containing protein [Pedobacter sp. Leaf170]|uniref:DUF262 domain-containing protein n=1 Tax=Pedobacter sp. Leaf170 TaxID=2876558 RepID=UPI001E628674|nr:DUF262 domain-containing protein [Pedobacter sp. Leaf170]